MKRPVALSRPTVQRSLAPLVSATLLLLISAGMLLAGGRLGAPGLLINADDPAAERFLVRFHAVEQNERERFRWAEPLAAAFLYGFSGQPAIVRLDLAAPRPPGVAGASLALSASGRELGAFPIAGGWRRYQLLVPTDSAGETALGLRSTAFTPVDDPRPLGVVLRAIGATPARSAGGPLVPARTLWLLALPLIGWLLAWRLGAGPWAALAVALPLALLVGWAAASPSAGDYWLPALAWPWWPTLPLVLLALAPQLGQAGGAARAWIDAHPAVGWAGLAIALAALAALRLGLPALPGIALGVGGVWVGLSKVTGTWQPVQEPTAASAYGHGPLLGCILLLALFLRLYNLDGQPGGLWRDEARHALQALQIWEDPSYRPVYVVEGADLPALLFYLMAPAVGLLGPHVWSARLVSALAGALTSLALYWAAAPLAGRRAALLGAALYACASWGLSMSRWAFPATLDHLLVLSAIGLLWRGLDRTQPSDTLPPQQRPGPFPSYLLACACAGLLGGLATYAYHTGRMAPLALAGLAVVRLGRSPAAWRHALPGLAVATLAGLLALAPMGAYLLADLEGYNRRVGNVSVFDSVDLHTHAPLGLLLDNLERYALMWHLRGEPNGRHHMPDLPLLDPLSGLLLALGLGVALPAARTQRGLRALLMLWAIYFIPGVFSGDAPHAMRSLGTLAPACALAGFGLATLARRQAASGRQQAARQRLLFYLLPLAFCLCFNAWVYFGLMRVEPRVYGEFDLVETAMGRIVQNGPATGVAVYMPARLIGADTVRFLSHAARPQPLPDGPIPGAGPALVLLPADASAPARAAALAALGPGAAELGPAPTTPDGARPLLIALGRGAAAAALIGAQTDAP